MSYLEPGVAPNRAIDCDFANNHASASWLFYKYKSDTFKPITKIKAFNGKIINSLCRGLDGLLVPSAFFFFFFYYKNIPLRPRPLRMRAALWSLLLFLVQLSMKSRVCFLLLRLNITAFQSDLKDCPEKSERQSASSPDPFPRLFVLHLIHPSWHDFMS